MSDDRRPPAPSDDADARRASRRRLVGIGLLFLVLAGLQAWVVLTSGAATAGDAALTRLALDPRAPRWVLREPGPESTPVATALHDVANRRLLVAAPGLESPGKGVFVLWYLRPGGEPPEVAAAFRPTRSGVDLLLEGAPSPRELSGLLVTEEPGEARPARLDPSRVRARYETER